MEAVPVQFTPTSLVVPTYPIDLYYVWSNDERVFVYCQETVQDR